MIENNECLALRNQLVHARSRLPGHCCAVGGARSSVGTGDKAPTGCPFQRGLSSEDGSG